MTGKRVGRLTVTERGPNKGGKATWWCECDCGNRVLRTGYHLRQSLKVGDRPRCSRECAAVAAEKLANPLGLRDAELVLERPGALPADQALLRARELVRRLMNECPKSGWSVTECALLADLQLTLGEAA